RRFCLVVASSQPPAPRLRLWPIGARNFPATEVRTNLERYAYPVSDQCQTSKPFLPLPTHTLHLVFKVIGGAESYEVEEMYACSPECPASPGNLPWSSSRTEAVPPSYFQRRSAAS